jgi:hypothetical protein
MTDHSQIQAWFDKRPISRSEVLSWENKRASKGLRKFGVTVGVGDVDALRQALADTKLAMGRIAIEQRLAREISMSDRITGAIARASRGRRRVSQVELFVPGARAGQMPAWYLEKAEADDEAVFLQATPDHHLFRPIEEPPGQEVWETTGGSPIASRFFFELDSTDGLMTPADPTYPVQMTGSAKLARGTVIGGIRHQFRDENGGVRALLTVEFPWLMGPYGPAAHRWHLASEFSAWIEAAATAAG